MKKNITFAQVTSLNLFADSYVCKSGKLFSFLLTTTLFLLTITSSIPCNIKSIILKLSEWRVRVKHAYESLGRPDYSWGLLVSCQPGVKRNGDSST